MGSRRLVVRSNRSSDAGSFSELVALDFESDEHATSGHHPKVPTPKACGVRRGIAAHRPTRQSPGTRCQDERLSWCYIDLRAIEEGRTLSWLQSIEQGHAK